MVKALIVDDDSFVRGMLTTILESGNYEVETAENGIVAAEKLRSDPDIAIIVSDMNMPLMNGLELIKSVRAGGSDVPIIILTGNNEISIAAEAIRSGANDYLLKDENIPDTIVLSVEKVLEKHNLRMQNIRLMADLAEKNERLEREMSLAQKVQMKILPEGLCISGLDIKTFYRPSWKIGGDFFDAWEHEGFVHFLICDVSGHSASSALIMAFSKGILRSIGSVNNRPAEVIAAANRMLCEILQDSGMFLSMVYGTFDRSINSLTVLSAGHNPVFLTTKDGTLKIDSTGPVVGWDAEDEWEVLDFEFNPGDLLFLYTDGVTESRSESGDEFGERRLLELCRENRNPEVLIEKVLKEVSAFSSEVFTDDITMFAIKRSWGPWMNG